MVEISTSILSVEKENAIKTFYNLETAKIDYFHIDVMDGKFVKNNTTDQMREYCDYLSSITNIPLDVHLMVKDVKKYVDTFLPYNPNIITLHYEAVKDKNELIDLVDYIHHNNCKAGISIKPNTDVSEIYDVLEILNVVLVMTVEPGEGGQPLIPGTIDKIKELSEYIKKHNLDTIVEADGGINIENASKLTEAGTEILVVGTGLIKTENYNESVKCLKNS
jgi:ribulose-phosphate 3-epimerase